MKIEKKKNAFVGKYGRSVIAEKCTIHKALENPDDRAHD